MALKEFVTGIVLLIVALAYGYLGLQLPERSVPNVPGPAFFPGLVALFILLLSISLTIKGLIGLKSKPHTSGALTLSWQSAMVIVWCFCFVAILPYAGFLLSAIPFFFGINADVR